MTDEITVPDVSVVIPCFNAERWVGRAIHSVLTQEGVTVEVIVIDDGSTDGSSGVIRRYQERVHWETGRNRGACAARNVGIKVSSGMLIKFLDADDYLLPGALRSQFNHARSLDSKSFSYGRVMRHIENDGRLIPHSPRDARSENQDQMSNMLRDPPVTSAMMYPRALLTRLDGFDEGLLKRQDYDLFARALLLGYSPVACKAPIYAYVAHAGEYRISRRKGRIIFDNQLKMFRRQADMLGNVTCASRYEELCAGLAATIWVTGRDCFRLGHKEEAPRFFELAFSLARKRASVGGRFYNLLVRCVGPLYAESLLQGIKKVTN